MKRIFCVFAFIISAVSAGGHNIVPKPVWAEHGGGSFVLPGELHIFYLSFETQPLARYLADEVGGKWGIKQASTHALLRAFADSKKGIRLYVDTEAGLPEEGYLLEVNDRGVTVTGADYGGLFNGIQTLLQLMPTNYDDRNGIGCVKIYDYPRFAYRGMHLDVARTFVDKDGVLRFIDNISRHKINKFHWHLTDDEGWRIEIKSRPELAAVGGFRGGDSPIMAIYGEWDSKYGGYFTQQDIKDVVKYASVRNIEIIPEIEFPGHSRAAARVYPQILCLGPADTVSTAGYDRRDVWCVSREENYEIIDDILREVSALFPSQYIHVGGDEVNMAQWRSCSGCKALMEREGLADGHQLECWFMGRVEEILARYGKTPAVWNEAVNGGRLSKLVRVHGWENTRACLKAVSEGFSTVVMPGSYFYFDMKYTKDEPGMTWAGIVSTERAYSFDFEKEGFSSEVMKNVAGVEGAFWSELYLSNDESYLDRQTYPRICALAEVAWTPQELRDWNDFDARMNAAHYQRLSNLGIKYRVEPVPAANPVLLYPKLAVTSSMNVHKGNPFSNLEAYKYGSHARTTRTCVEGDYILFTFDERADCAAIEFVTGYSYLRRSIIPSGYAEISYSDGGGDFVRCGDLVDGMITITPAKPVGALRIVSTSPRNGESTVIIQPLKIIAKQERI